MIKRLIFCCSLLILVLAASSQKVAKLKIEDVVKSFSAKNDTTYVVNFWATFCKPCNEELPYFIKIAEQYKSKKVKLLLVSLDLPDYYPVKIAAFAKAHNYKTNLAWLNETNADRFCPMIDAKWSGAIPATIIVNNKTGYRKFVEDEINAVDFEKALNEALPWNAVNKYLAPMNNAEVIKYDFSRSTAYVKVDYMTFKSNDSAVYSINEGKVNMVARIDGMKVMIVEKDNFYYTYSNLGSTLFKKGDEVKAGQLIGYAALDLDGYKPTVELTINKGENAVVLTEADFVKRMDKKRTDHSFDSKEPK